MQRSPPRTAWSNRAHLTVSQGNSKLSIYNREYFDKPHKMNQVRDPLKYVQKTPFDSRIDYMFYKDYS